VQDIEKMLAGKSSDTVATPANGYLFPTMGFGK
jgi:hypothetical protein